MNTNQLKSLNVETTDKNDLILARNSLKVLDAGYVELEMETEEWILDKITEVVGELIKRSSGELQKKLRAAKARRAALATPDEKRTALDDQISMLEKKMGIKQS